MGRNRKLGLGRLEADHLAVALPLGGKVGRPASSVQRDIANSALLSLDQHPDVSNPEQDAR